MMDTQVVSALSAAIGGLLVGAGAVMGFLLKQGVFSNGKKDSNPVVFEKMLAELQGVHDETQGFRIELQSMNAVLSKAVEENREAHRRIEERQTRER